MVWVFLLPEHVKIFFVKNISTLHIFIFGFIIAIFVSSFFQLGISFSFFLIFLSIIIFLFRFLVIHEEEKRKILYVGLTLLSFGLGIFRYEIRDQREVDQNLENIINQSVFIEGTVSDEPQRKELKQTLIVDLKDIFHGSSSTPVSGKVVVSTDLYPEFQYGDLIKISGKLKKPENFTSSSSKDFDYISYLGKDDIFYKIDFAKVTLVSSGEGSALKSYLFSIKNSFIQSIGKVISEPESSLLAGILLGAKTSLDTKTTDIFRTAGVSHIVALSGYNITIVAKAVMSILTWLPRGIASSFGILSIILFVIMSGGTSTAVRAGIMSVIALLGTITHRKYDIGRALIVTLFLMVFINPKILVFDISFQLSCLATLAIIYVSPIVKNKLSFIPERFGLKDIISTTLSAQILVLPFILYKMGLLSLVALPANILILPVMPATMFSGFVTGVCAIVSTTLSLPFAFISYLLLTYIIHIADFFASLPFSAVTVSWFSGSMMMVCYIFITIWVVREHKK